MIQVTKITPASESTLEDVEDEIRQTLLAEKEQTLWDSWLKQATTNADVKYAPGYDPKQLLKEAASATPEASPTEEATPSDDASPEAEESPEAQESPEAEESPEPSPTSGE